MKETIIVSRTFGLGMDIDSVARRLILLAIQEDLPHETDFNGFTLRAEPYMRELEDVTQPYWDHWAACDAARKQEEEEFRKTPEAQAQKARAEEAERKRQEFVTAPFASFDVSDPELWQKCIDNNPDGYGSAVNRYAAYWASLMEVELAQGKTVAESQEPTSRQADIEGITGFQFGAARATLRGVWRYGDQLSVGMY